MRVLGKKKRVNRRLVPARKRRPLNWRPMARGCAGVMTVTALAIGSMQLLEPRTLPLRALEIEAQFNYVSVQEIQAAVEPYTRQGFFGVDVIAARRQLLELPWVATAEVRRQWPDRLLVTVYEQRPLARWGANAVVNDDGKMFAPLVATIPGDLPLLDGPPHSEGEVAATYRQMMHVLRPLDLHVRQLQLDERRSWRVTLDNGIEVVLGRQDADQRMVRFIEFYKGLRAAHEAAAEIDRVDLRYGNGFAVQWATTANKSDKGVS